MRKRGRRGISLCETSTTWPMGYWHEIYVNIMPIEEWITFGRFCVHLWYPDLTLLYLFQVSLVKKYVISCEKKVDIHYYVEEDPRYKQISTLNPKTRMYVLKKLLKKIPFRRTKLFKNISLFQRIIQMFIYLDFQWILILKWTNFT